MTVEHVCSSSAITVEFYGSWVGELRAIVSEDDREELHEYLSAKGFIELIEDIRHGSGVVEFTLIGDHE